MIVSLIVAVDEKGGIGKNNKLSWHLSSDLKRFKSLTMGHHLVMGRKTYETIGKPLPGRVMIILSHCMTYKAEGCLVVNSIKNALAIAERNQETEVFIIGGGQVFKQSIELADKIYLTKVYADIDADVFFPDIDRELWKIEHRESIARDQKDEYGSDFSILVRKNKDVDVKTK